LFVHGFDHGWFDEKGPKELGKLIRLLANVHFAIIARDWLKSPNSTQTMETESELLTLRSLLLKRLEIIGDERLREEDPEEQLRRLQRASEEIEAWHRSHAESLPPRLRHFLEQVSYQKALEWIDQRTGTG
jgi:hypothetical protein